MLNFQVLGCFVAVELPQGVILLVCTLDSSVYEKVYGPGFGDLIDLLTLLSSALNFALYCTMSAQFRETFHTIFVAPLVAALMHYAPTQKGTLGGPTQESGQAGWTAVRPGANPKSRGVHIRAPNLFKSRRLQFGAGGSSNGGPMAHIQARTPTEFIGCTGIPIVVPVMMPAPCKTPTKSPSKQNLNLVKSPVPLHVPEKNSGVISKPGSALSSPTKKPTLKSPTHYGTPTISSPTRSPALQQQVEALVATHSPLPRRVEIANWDGTNPHRAGSGNGVQFSGTGH